MIVKIDIFEKGKGLPRVHIELHGKLWHDDLEELEEVIDDKASKWDWCSKIEIERDDGSSLTCTY